MAPLRQGAGRAPAARQWLDLVARAGESVGAPWNCRQTLGVLRREAEELLKSGPGEANPIRP